MNEENYRTSQNLTQPSTSGRMLPSIRELLPSASTSQYSINVGKRNTKMKNDHPDELTPRKKLMEEFKKTQLTFSSLKESIKLIKENEPAMLQSLVPLNNPNTTPKGRDWTPNNKIAALVTFKCWPDAYKLMGYMMPLPNIEMLQHIASRVPMDTGINGSVLHQLKKQALITDEKNRMCVLLFDEMILKPSLVYNEISHRVDGYEDFGKNYPMDKSDKEADNAIVFMIQGLIEKFKQPLAYYFVKRPMSAGKLAAIIKDNIRHVNATGYRVLATVCDQAPTNIAALNLLKQYSGSRSVDADNFFLVEDQQVFVVYDIPHLFRSLRNNFLNNGTIVMNGKTGKWAYLREIQEKNKSSQTYCKINTSAVTPKYRAKMRIKYAAQALSYTVASVLKIMSLTEKEKKRAKEIVDTAAIIQHLDRLFDVTNGPASKEDKKPGQRELCSPKTNHLTVWGKYQQTLSTLKFLRNDGSEANDNKCVQGFLLTLFSFQDIWREVTKAGLRHLNLRNLNLDALINLFEVVREFSAKHKHPTCTEFVSALKTAIISDITAPQNLTPTCEKDSFLLLTRFQDHIFDMEQILYDLS